MATTMNQLTTLMTDYPEQVSALLTAFSKCSYYFNGCSIETFEIELEDFDDISEEGVLILHTTIKFFILLPLDVSNYMNPDVLQYFIVCRDCGNNYNITYNYYHDDDSTLEEWIEEGHFNQCTRCYNKQMRRCVAEIAYSVPLYRCTKLINEFGGWLE